MSFPALYRISLLFTRIVRCLSGSGMVYYILYNYIIRSVFDHENDTWIQKIQEGYTMAQIADIIKYEGDNSTFVWKCPNEDFNSLTQLIVHESQEAVFMLNGQALDLFGPGRYTLETQNTPKIGGILNRATGDQTPFHCEVYFVNQTVQMGLKWGTDSKIRYLDPDSGIPIELGASGEMNLRVCDSRKLLIKLVGTMTGIAWGTEGVGFTKSLQSSFRPLISTAVKSNLSPAIKTNKISIFEIDEHLTELSTALHSRLLPEFEEYGLTIPQFYLTTVVLPEDDVNFRRLRELHTISLQTRMTEAEAQVRTAQAKAEADVAAARRQIELEKQTTQTEIARREAERKLIDAQAEAQARRMEGMAEADVMRAKGYSEKDLIQADVQKAYAQGLGNFGANASGGSSAMNDILGLGLGLKAAGVVGGQLNGLFDGMGFGQQPAGTAAEDPQRKTVCPACGAKLPANAKFCLECGMKIEQPAENEMICPACGKKTPKGKFCMECGAPLVNQCPNCGAELPNGAKFCLECGSKV